MPRAVFALLVLVLAGVGLVSPRTEVAEAAPAPVPPQVTATVERARQAQQAAAAERVAAAIRAGEQARAMVDTARRDRQERAARDAVRSALPGCDVVPSGIAFPNGEWPPTALCELPGGGHFLRPDAAEAYVRLSFAYAHAFGAPPCLTDSYRSLAGQRRLARTKPRLAARAGTSTHGDGVAVDLCGGVEGYGTAQHAWMREHGPRFGWDNPDWARADGARPEPWHWEYTGPATP